MNPPRPPPPPPPSRAEKQSPESRTERDEFGHAPREEVAIEEVGDEIQIEDDDELCRYGIQEQQQSLETNENKMAILNVRSLMGESLQILVTSDMLQEELAQSIAHAVLSPSEGTRLLECWSSDEDVIDWSKIAGLFREDDGVFVPLSLLLHDCKRHEHDMFRVSRRPGRRPMEKIPPNLSFWREIVLYLIIAVYLGYKYSTGRDINVILDRSQERAESFLGYIINLPFQIVEVCIDFPLKELYRFGPSIVGWEGQSLPLICSQITHMGDESFWSRNLDECQKIYDNKEVAMLHFRKPLVFCIISYLAFLVIRSLVQAWAIKEQNRPHPEMVEIYQTFKMLMNVVHKGFNGREDDRRRSRHR